MDDVETINPRSFSTLYRKATAGGLFAVHAFCFTQSMCQSLVARLMDPTNYDQAFAQYFLYCISKMPITDTIMGLLDRRHPSVSSCRRSFVTATPLFDKKGTCEQFAAARDTAANLYNRRGGIGSREGKELTRTIAARYDAPVDVGGWFEPDQEPLIREVQDQNNRLRQENIDLQERVDRLLAVEVTLRAQLRDALNDNHDVNENAYRAEREQYSGSSSRRRRRRHDSRSSSSSRSSSRSRHSRRSRRSRRGGSSRRRLYSEERHDRSSTDYQTPRRDNNQNGNGNSSGHPPGPSGSNNGGNPPGQGPNPVS